MATNHTNTNRVEPEALDNHHLTLHTTLHTTRLKAFAELASQQPYIVASASEPPAPGLLLLAKAAVLILGKDSNNGTPASTKMTTSNNTAAVRTTDISDDSAEEVIEVRPLKRAKTSASWIANDSAPGNWKRSTKSFSVSQRRVTNKNYIPKRASQVSAPAFQLPVPSLYKGAPLEEVENEDEEDSQFLKGRERRSAKLKGK